MIKNFVFDFANVLAMYDVEKYAIELAGDEELGKFLHLHSFKSKEWVKYDAGYYNTEQIIEALSKEIPAEHHELLKKYVNTFENAFSQYDAMVPVLEKLKGMGYKMYLISDFPGGKFETIAAKTPILKLLDDCIVSYKVHMTKPHADIFNHLLEKHGLVASECVFTDDSAVNVKSAIALGMKGHTFTTAEDYCGYLKQIGIF